MKRLCFVMIAACMATPVAAQKAVSVGGYVNSSGQYVAPHYRSSPDATRTNNWSVSPNVNPYTGKIGTKPAYEPYKPYTYKPYKPK